MIINKEDIGKIQEIEDGYERIYFIEDEPTLLTFKKMINNFELVNMNNLNIEIEEEKFQMNNLTIKLLSSSKREKDFDTIESEKLSITSEDIKTIEFLLENHHNVAIFFQQLNKFRSS
jgi:ribosomal protein L9